MSLSGPKSSRNAEPNRDRSRIRHFRQNAATASRSSRTFGFTTRSPSHHHIYMLQGTHSPRNRPLRTQAKNQLPSLVSQTWTVLMRSRYNTDMQFEWDESKSTTNLRKHGVSFEEASSVFGDPLAITFQDPAHSAGEHRFLAFGVSVHGTLLVVSFVHRRKRTRLISARPATRGERKIYEEA